jgi:hypothetical protein
MMEMAESGFEAQPYANWMIDKVVTIDGGVGITLGRLVGRVTLARRMPVMARQALGEELPWMVVPIRSRTDEEGILVLKFWDWVATRWMDIAQ